MESNKQMNSCCEHEGTKQIKGVRCDVKNCAYNDGQNECFAGTICVGPCEASCAANTSCATFKPKHC